MLYELTALTKQFKDRVVLDIASLRLQRNKVYALIGPNGAGKTTLLEHLALLQKPTTGGLSFLGRDPWGAGHSLLALRRRVVLVDQNPILFSGTVKKNVEYGLLVRKFPKDERYRRVRHYLGLVGMGAFIDQEVHGLSGGEVKRVALARALAIEPEVLLCDEPTANVDERHQEIILGILEHVNWQNNTTIIFSTHLLSQSRRLADQTIMLRNGRVSPCRQTNNQLRGQLLENDEHGLTIRLADRCIIHLPPGLMAGSNHDDIVQFILDPAVLSIHDQATKPDRSAALNRGVIRRIASEQAQVRIAVDIGISIDILLDGATYRTSAPLVGDQVLVAIPAAAVRCKQERPLL